MKKHILSLLAITAAVGSVSARGISPVGIDNIVFERQGELMVLDMSLDFNPTEVDNSRAQILTPLIVSEKGDTVTLPSVGIYGRLRYINYLRNGEMPFTGKSEEMFKESERPSAFAYHATAPFEDWMIHSRLLMRRSLYGCADCLVDQRTDKVTEYYQVDPAIPEIVYFEAADQAPIVESLEGAAYIDFIVDKTNIEPGYRRNPQELYKIQASIDTVLNDKDVTITGVWLKGFASPESPYSHNTDLAIGRTKALKDYINQLYKFDKDIISTDFEPEDWAGLRKFVVNSNINNKEGILMLIDSSMEPDAKEAKIKATYPAEYKFMLQNFYPALRHTEYRITYEVKRFDDLDKIRQVMRTRPNRLTLREFFLLGNAAEPGSEEFNDVYETAVRMYPDNPTANINAANAALQRKDFELAEKYLSKAGDSPEAIYARGSLAFLKGDYDKAEELMKEVPMIPASFSTLQEIMRMRQSQVEKSSSTTLR